MSNLLKKIISHTYNISSNHGKSLKAKCTKFRDYIISQLKDPYCKLEYFCRSQCSCGKGKFLSSLYGANVVCQHMIFAPCKEFIERLGKEDSIKKEIILSILIKDRETPHKKMEDKILKIKREICELFQIKQEEQANVETLAQSIMKCFQLEPGPQIKFEMDYNFQKVIIEHTDSIIYFNERDDSNKNKKKTKLKKVDNDFWFKDITSDIMKKAHKLKYETLLEIEAFYPDLKENNLSIQICDFNFRKYFYQRDENELVYTFPQFKISCWKDADQTMKSNIFFD